MPNASAAGIRKPATHRSRWLLADERQALVRQAIARMRRRDAEILHVEYPKTGATNNCQHLGATKVPSKRGCTAHASRLRKEMAAFRSKGATMKILINSVRRATRSGRLVDGELSQKRSSRTASRTRRRARCLARCALGVSRNRNCAATLTHGRPTLVAQAGDAA